MSADARVADVAYSRTTATRGPAGGDLVARPLERAARAGRPPRLEGEADPDRADPDRVHPALVVLGLRALFGPTVFRGGLADALPYSNYTATIGIVILVFSVVVTPELLCPDRRDGTLSLYFSTAIGRCDYVLAKLLAALMPILLVTLVPPLILYAGNLLFAVHPVGYLDKHAADILRIVGSGLLIGIFYGSSASRSRRSPRGGPSPSAATWRSSSSRR